jgi:hypothetical protein
VPDHVHLVFSLPPAQVSRGEWEDWYDLHLEELVAGDGFTSARRYWLAPASPERPSVEFAHLAVYRTDGPPAHALSVMGERIAAGELTMPEWFGDIGFLTYNGRPLETEELEYPDQAYVVLSHAPSRFNDDEFNGWYYAHARENLTSEGFASVRRFALEPVLSADDIAGRARHGAFYDCTGPLDDLRASLRASAEAGRVDIPAWMREGEFFSYLATAP